ncbi:MAG: tRNA pseudouridine(55) synthase TruB [Candidatus Saccharimonadales bacterium]
MDGILLVDKPESWTSHDVVGKIRSSLRSLWQTSQPADLDRAVKFRVGHAGTLDPMATGLLIVLVGKATKAQADFMKLDKWYTAEMTLGAISSTDDAEGKITTDLATGRAQPPTLADVETVLQRFRGPITQLPPQHSAIKIDGQRAYKLARRGEPVELHPRPVIVHEISGISYHYPRLGFNVHVSSGTYIRSLARDIGAGLGVGGYLSSLRRTAIGEWSVATAVSPQLTAEELRRQIIPLEQAFI